MNWRPIESAPKDGSRVLCWAEGWEPTFLVWKENTRFKPSRWYFGDPNEMDDYDLSEVGGGPTLWLEIPHPQKDKKSC